MLFETKLEVSYSSNRINSKYDKAKSMVVKLPSPPFSSYVEQRNHDSTTYWQHENLSHLTLCFCCHLGEHLLSLAVSPEYPGPLKVGGNVNAL